MERYRLKEKYPNWDAILPYMHGYSVDSLELSGLHYVIEDGFMAMARHNEVALWELSQTPTEAARVKEPYRSEILAIYEDIKGLRGYLIEDAGKPHKLTAEEMAN